MCDRVVVRDCVEVWVEDGWVGMGRVDRIMQGLKSKKKRSPISISCRS